MGERYWVTGVQLGMLKELRTKATRNTIITDIMNQFIGNFPTEEDKKEFIKQINNIYKNSHKKY